MKIHFFGASGSGVSTLGRYLAEQHSHAFIDADDIYWEPTAIPFETSKSFERRQQDLSAAVAGKPGWVISGSMMRWGDFLIPEFDFVVFVEASDEERLARLKERETLRYGERLRTEVQLQDKSAKFLTWAMRYNHSDMEGRSRARHEEWIKSLPCPVYRINNSDLAESKTSLEQIYEKEEMRWPK